MTWRYNARSGELTDPRGRRSCHGYSGRGACKNDPAQERVVAHGPIPSGRWKIGAPYDSKRVGQYALPLTPVGHDAHGRSAFRIHGDSKSAPGTASHGCIVVPRAVREAIWESGDRDLDVV